MARPLVGVDEVVGGFDESDVLPATGRVFDLTLFVTEHASSYFEAVRQALIDPGSEFAPQMAPAPALMNAERSQVRFRFDPRLFEFVTLSALVGMSINDILFQPAKAASLATDLLYIVSFCLFEATIVYLIARILAVRLLTSRPQQRRYNCPRSPTSLRHYQRW